MALSNIVQVNLTLNGAAPQILGVGFGSVLILSANTNQPAGTVTWVTSKTDLSDLGLDTQYGPEVRAWNALQAQPKPPDKIAIGSIAGSAPTQKHTFKVGTVTVGQTYAFGISSDQGAFSDVVAYTAIADDTSDLIIAGLLAAFNALDNVADYSCTAGSSGGSGSHVLNLTASGPGKWTRVMPMCDPAFLTFAQTHTSPGTGDLDTLLANDPTFYMIVNLYNSRAVVNAIAGWTETAKRMFSAGTQDLIIVASASTDNVCGDLKTANYSRTFTIFDADNGAFTEAGWDGACLSFVPGEETWKFKKIVGSAANAYTATQENRLKAVNCNYYMLIGGQSMTTEGYTASGEFIDIVRGLDWAQANLQNVVFQILLEMPKVPYTDTGVAILEGALRGELKRMMRTASGNPGLIAETPEPVFTVPTVASQSDADRNARHFPGLNFTARLSGAVHDTEIAGSLNV